MVNFDFLGLEVMGLPSGLVVCGRCGEADFGTGDIFTELRWSVYERRESPKRWECVAEDIAAEVRLRVEEISFYNRIIDRLYPGCTAGIRVSGTGLELLGTIDFQSDFRTGKQWSLWGERHV